MFNWTCFIKRVVNYITAIFYILNNHFQIIASLKQAPLFHWISENKYLSQISAIGAN